MEIVDDTLTIEDNVPGSSVSNIPTDEEDAYLESTPNTQTSNTCQQSLDQADSKPTRLKLCGAARKRLKLYLQQGMSIDEARNLCLKPMKEARNELKGLKLPRKRGRSDGSTPEKPNPPKRAQGTAAAGTITATKTTDTPQITTQPTYKDMAEVIKLGIIPPDFPTTIWSDTKLHQIQTAVLDKIVELNKGSLKPQFAGCSFKPGWLTFNCKGEESAQWVKEYVPLLKPWEDAVLKVVAEDEVPKTEVFIGYFPEKPETPTTRMLALIEGQNAGLSAECWKVLNRVSKGHIVELTIAIDPISASKLRLKNFHISYGFGTVHVRPTKQQGPGNEVPKKAKLTVGPRPAATSTEDPRDPNSGSELPSCSTKVNKPDALREGKQSSSGSVSHDLKVSKDPQRVSGDPTRQRLAFIPSTQKPPAKDVKRTTTTTKSRPRKGHSTTPEEAVLQGSNRSRKMAARSKRQ